MKIWILTREINDYNQEGEYFEAAFKEKPTKELLSKTIDEKSDYILNHILNGGGQQEQDYVWYNLEEYELQ